MISRTCLLFALSCLVVACQSSPGWSVRDAAPDDLMVKSWELSDAPPPGELMVVRCQYDFEVAGERQRATRELFVSTGGARHAEPIVYVPEVPSPVDPAGKWTLVGCGDSRSQPGYMSGSTWNMRELDLGFASGDGSVSIVRYFVERESLASARARIPALCNLPDTGVWKFLAGPEHVGVAALAGPQPMNREREAAVVSADNCIEPVANQRSAR